MSTEVPRALVVIRVPCTVEIVRCLTGTAHFIPGLPPLLEVPAGKKLFGHMTKASLRGKGCSTTVRITQ